MKMMSFLLGLLKWTEILWNEDTGWPENLFLPFIIVDKSDVVWEVSNMSRSSCRLSEKMSYCAINMIINVIYRPHYKWQPRGPEGGAATLCKYLALINICLLSPVITIWGHGLVTTQNILCLVPRKLLKFLLGLLLHASSNGCHHQLTATRQTFPWRIAHLRFVVSHFSIVGGGLRNHELMMALERNNILFLKQVHVLGGIV